ncbi:MAG: LysR family transcriptional regulator [Polyangiaceae bacterium]|nr:LysR family transcriptional regulator [Polyangiaceae bacterium]MCB9606920.1 LysR family transcriptional regulator [Polyangiaceae bacterium]
MNRRAPQRPRTERAATRLLDRWDDIQLLLSVARSGSFTRAAAALGIEQSTVSRRIAALEAQLGSELFAPHPGGPGKRELTPLGERLIRHAETVEASVLAFTDEALGHETEVSGRVRVALTESLAVHVVIPNLVAPLRRTHPRLTLELISSDLASNLGHREAEIAARFFRPKSGDLVSKRVARLPTAVLATREVAQIPFSRMPWIVCDIPGVPTPERAWYDRHIGSEPALITNTYVAQQEAVRCGLGAALLTRTTRLLDPNLVELDLGLAGPELALWLTTPRALRRVPRIRAVWDALESALGALDA